MPEAAELAGVEPATIAYWYTTGKISVRKTGKIIRIPREAFEQWLLKRKEKGWYSMASIQKKNTNIVSYITVKIQMESGNRSGKRMIQRTQLKSEKTEIELKEKKAVYRIEL